MQYEATFQAGGSPLPTFRGRVSFTSRAEGHEEIEKEAIHKIQRRYGPMPIRIFGLVRLEA